MLRRIEENVVCWLEGLQVSDMPKVLPAGITLHLKAGIIGLEAQGVVGAFPLNNGDTIHIVPKIGEVNFLRLLFKAEGQQTSLDKEFENFVQFSLSNEENVGSIVARQLFVCVDEILRKSPLQGREKYLHHADYVAGEMVPLKTAIGLAIKRSDPVVSLVKRRTVNIAENRIITEALMRAWNLIKDDSREKMGAIYARWIRKFPRSKNVHSDLWHVDKSFAVNAYGGSRDYYRHTLMLAKIILGSFGVALASSAEIYGDAVLMNSADVFEKYLRNVLIRKYAAEGYVVSKGGPGSRSLYTDGSFELIPDIVISRDDEVILIADAKYKKPTGADHYQMASYLTAHKLKRGVLLAPLTEGRRPIVKEYSTADKTIVREIYLPMVDLEATEETLTSLVANYSR